MKSLRNYLCLSLLILTLGLMGCATKPNVAETPTTVIPIVKNNSPQKNLIITSKLTIKPLMKGSYTVIGTTTNNNKMSVDVNIMAIFSNADGTPLQNEGIIVGQIEPGETKNFSSIIASEVDMNKATYKIQVEDFAQKADGTW